MVESVIENVRAWDIRPLRNLTSMDRPFRDFKDNVRPLRTTTWKLKARITEGYADTDHIAAGRSLKPAWCCWGSLRTVFTNTFQLVFEVEYVSSLCLIRAVSNQRLNLWRLLAGIQWLFVSRYRVESPTSQLFMKFRDRNCEAVTVAAWLQWWRMEAQI